MLFSMHHLNIQRTLSEDRRLMSFFYQNEYLSIGYICFNFDIDYQYIASYIYIKNPNYHVTHKILVVNMLHINELFWRGTIGCFLRARHH
jgi:hypothetical protein